MHISTFSDLINIARQQTSAQRLLFLFAMAELPTDASDTQKVNFEDGHGGTLTPLMSVDKATEDIQSFEQIAKEADEISPNWHLVFVAALQNSTSHLIDTEMVETALNNMTQNIYMGQIDGLLPFDRQGNALQLESD